MKSEPGRPLPQFFARVGLTVVSLLAVVVLLELLSWMAASAYHWIHTDPYAESASPIYAGDSWGADFWREESVRARLPKTYIPFRIWGVTEWHGKYVNTDIGEMGLWRRTLNPKCEQQPTTNIWVFGGSAVFGTGVPDWATLPSSLARSLNGTGLGCIAVTNLGVEGYATTQELILLTEQLKAGRRPDIVIFYDGFNDAAAGLDSPDPRNGHYGFATIQSRIEGSWIGRLDFLKKSYTFWLVQGVLKHLFRVQAPPLSGAESQAKAPAILDNYESNLRIVNLLSKAYNFKVYSFWQPVLIYGHKPLAPFEQRLVDLDAGPNSRVDSAPIGVVYREAQGRAEKNGDFVFLGGLFDSVKEPIYVDEVHPGPLGNALLAEEIAKYVRGDLESAKEQRHADK